MYVNVLTFILLYRRSAMNVYVQLNDVFDRTSPTVMEIRRDFAFGTDGTDFWKKFFFCDEIHPDDRIIYLFTEYQLAALWKWWDKQITAVNNEDIRQNLDYSKQKLFNSLPKRNEKFKEIFACYVIYNPGCPEIQRVHFGDQPKRYLSRRGRLKNNDFFAGRFREKPSNIVLTEKERKEQLLKLVSMRKEIADEFGGPIAIKKNINWMRYLAPKHTAFVKNIDYCVDIDNCPLAAGIPVPTPAAAP